MAFSHEPLLLLLLTFSAFWFSSISAASSATSRDASTAKPQRLVTKLIHHRSIHHPNYNKKETAKERMELDIKHSLARVAYLHARIEGSLVSGDYRTNISPSMGGRTILANISIGQPPIPQLVIMDTGSDIFWIMCIPCSNCAQHSGELFDPLKSSTYAPLCRTPCGFNGCRCNNLGQATFNITYADHSLSSGTLGKDMLVFETADEGATQVPNVEFGCGLNVVYNSDPGYNGILGLNNGPLSLASQIGQKFSYCIGSLSDKNYNFNQLILGDGADLEGYSTSFQVRNGMYYLTMEGISIGEKRLDVAPATFELKADGTGGVILDTGSTVTYLVDEVFDLLVEEVGNILSRSLRQVRFEAMPWLLCYSGTLSRDLTGFPVVTFHFAQGADLALDTGSFFEQSLDDTFCMVVGPISQASIDSKSSIIGLLAQQSYNVGYDLVNRLIYFQRIDCELLSG